MNTKIRILAIAPYEAMRSTLIRIANSRNDIELTVEVGSIEEGARIAEQYENEDFDAIISRGGTKLEIQKVTTKPVFEIPISHFDLINIIKLIENYNGKVGIIAYENIAKSARILCEFLHCDYSIFVIDSHDDAKEKAEMLKSEGYSLIVGDTVAVTYSEEIGLQSMLLVSSHESISQAIDNVVNVCNYYSRLKMGNAFFQAYVRGRELTILAMDESGNVAFSTYKDEKKTLITICRNMIAAIRAGETTVVHKKLSGSFFIISGSKSRLSGTTYYFFNIQKSRMSMSHIAGFKSVDVYNYDEFSDNDSKDLVYSRDSYKCIWKRCEKIAASKTPVIITGEPGSEKERVAGKIYHESSIGHNPFYIVNCSTLTEKEVEHLLNSETSPLYALHSTVHFKGVHALESMIFEKLMDGLQSMTQILRCRMLFTYEIRSSRIEESQDNYRCDAVKNRIGCVEIKLPPLRDFPGDIPNLAVLYIHRQNITNGTHIIGLEPEAVSLLEEYTWPQNVNQFERVLNEAIISTESPWITAKIIRRILANEKTSTAILAPGGANLNIQQPLSGIMYDVVMAVLEEEDMNQVKAAKRLGISRTTLWRLLKKHEE